MFIHHPIGNPTDLTDPRVDKQFLDYDAGSERGIRYVPRQMEGEYSGRTAGYTQDMDIILYPNALITVRPQELPDDFDPKRMHPEYTFTTYTKHYYIGSERINSKLGTVKDLGILCEQMGGNDLIGEMNRRVEEAGERLEDLHTDLDKDLRLNSPYPYSREHQIVCDFKSHDSELYDAYWYHPDHLGSSSFITNTTGEISQHMEYLPFGETLVEEHLNSYNSPFKFNAKEFDAETGNYYYGARYMNPKWSTFLTPDPALESYPGISPYAYTLNNPVRYVDPTGMYVESIDNWVLGKDGKYVYDGNVTSENDPNLGDREYIGKSLNDVKEHYSENNPIKSFLKIHPKFGENITSWPGEINSKENSMADNWEEGNFAQQVVYETVNSFSVVGQSLNPFDDNITTLRGESLNGMDRSEHGVNVISTVLPIGASGKVARYGVGQYFLNTSRPHSRLFKQDVAHRATTFFRGEILTKGNIGIKNHKTIYFNHTIGNRIFSIGINPWKRSIFHEGPGIFK